MTWLTHIPTGLEPPQNWPNCGTVKLENVSVRYGQETDPVLRDITVEFQAGEKVIQFTSIVNSLLKIVFSYNVEGSISIVEMFVYFEIYL